MAAISATTRATIKGYLEAFIETLVNEHRTRTIPTLGEPAAYLAQRSTRGQLKPFHAAIIPTPLLRINEFERGFSTSLGTTFEECARLVALEHHRTASRSFDLRGTVSNAALSEIERQVATFERAASTGTRLSLDGMVHAVLDARRDDDLVDRTDRADLYLQTHAGEQLFFEMKSPQPNRGQCLEVTQRILRLHLHTGMGRPQVQAFYGMAYNPFGPTRSDYRWSFARNYTPFEHAVLVGQEFWEIVGGETAYVELLDIYQEVGRDKSKDMLDALAFGF